MMGSIHISNDILILLFAIALLLIMMRLKWLGDENREILRKINLLSDNHQVYHDQLITTDRVVDCIKADTTDSKALHLTLIKFLVKNEHAIVTKIGREGKRIMEEITSKKRVPDMTRFVDYDFQKRDGSLAASGIPDTITSNWAINELQFEFYFTKKKDIVKWITDFAIENNVAITHYSVDRYLEVPPGKWTEVTVRFGYKEGEQ